ncbi:Cleft lip and palate transmembrane protein 1 [Musa troglodytarum]|uniref:Cleft lip and palate transmembrane protein 1 n=1 Tax=Musa troglodytarum TaxID=320322 RepID=A0A9E7GCN3_9LILI|nr:Cleft lip and palate transmembrane protein 1 [Musa troglodytarum]
MAQPAGRPMVAEAAARRAECAAAAAAGVRADGGGDLADGAVLVLRHEVLWPQEAAEPSQLISNLFHKGESLDMLVYPSENEKFKDFGDEYVLGWHESNIPYAVWGLSSTRSLSLKYYPSEAVKHIGSLYAHVFFACSGYPSDLNDSEYEPLSTFGKTHQNCLAVVAFLPKSKSDKKKSMPGTSKGSEEEELLKNNNHVEAKDEGPVEWVSCWKPNITINLVDDFTSLILDEKVSSLCSGRKKISLSYSSMPLLLMRKRCTSSVVTEESHHCLSMNTATGDAITASPTSGGGELLLYDTNLICCRAQYSTAG